MLSKNDLFALSLIEGVGAKSIKNIIDAKISPAKNRQVKGIWMMLKCMKCGVKHSAGFKMFRQ